MILRIRESRRISPTVSEACRWMGDWESGVGVKDRRMRVRSLGDGSSKELGVGRRCCDDGEMACRRDWELERGTAGIGGTFLKGSSGHVAW